MLNGIMVYGGIMIEIDDKLFKESLNHVATTEEGKIVLAHLKDVLGWDDIMMSLDSTEATTYYSTRRAVYGWLRKQINPAELKAIEFNYTRKAATNDGTSDRKHSTTNKRRGITAK